MSHSQAPKRVVMRGLYPATLTPFNPDLSIDVPSLRSHLKTIAGRWRRSSPAS